MKALRRHGPFPRLCGVSSRANPVRPDFMSASSRLALASNSGTCQICDAAEVHTLTLLGQVTDLQAAERTEQQAAANPSIRTAR